MCGAMVFRVPLCRSFDCSLSVQRRFYYTKVSSSPPANGEKKPRATDGAEAVQKDTADFQEKSILHYPPTNYFDTHEVVTNLQGLGYTHQQAEILVVLMAESLHGSLKPMWTSLITKKDMILASLIPRPIPKIEISKAGNTLKEQQLTSEVKALQTDLMLMKKGPIDRLHMENKVLGIETQNLSKLLKEDIFKLQSGMKVDVIKERSRIEVERAVLQQKIKDTNNKLSYEMAHLKSRMAAQKFESFKYLAGGIISIITIVVSVAVRLWRLTVQE